MTKLVLALKAVADGGRPALLAWADELPVNEPARAPAAASAVNLSAGASTGLDVLLRRRRLGP